ncbi:MAG TPA: ArsB/NhaD family transporter [Candidatus Bipolaricaulis sp.]|nr:ArsB/NhaD family transporter [Candidatus Bipolaricaulis sp.]HRS14469.1 ArsB/NhaD family transporter [Candidatus Bipolaricaulis sp.]HRU21287.1 ArsB/NhaD family transporter [Candidatus Bipolaricaulis sp.]
MGWPVLASALAIFAASYALIFSGYVHRTLAALVGAVAMIVAGSALGFYPYHAAVASIDMDTLWLLFGMMAIVGLLRETGFFQYIAIRAAKIAHGNLTILFLSLGAATAIASMFLDNVTTLLTVVPVTISVAEVLAIPAGPLLLMEAMASNIGGTATLTGDPPNILIGSAAGFSFNAFLTHTLPVALVVFAAAMAFLLARFRRLATPHAADVEAVMAMDERRALTHPQAMGKLVAVLGLVFALFASHSALGLTPGVVALIGAALCALIVRPNVEAFLHGVEWDLLIFLASLLVLTGGLEASGALAVVGRWTVGLAGGSTLLLALILLWVGAGLSWVLSAIPTTVTLAAVVRSLAGTGIPLTPLWWALSLGIGLGANGTPLGSAANMVLISIADRTHQGVKARAWLRDGIPVALLSCLIASAFLWLGIATGWFL